MTACACTATSRAVMVTQGETVDLAFTVRDPRGDLLDLTGTAAYLTVRARVDDPATVIVKRSILAGGDATQIELLDQTTYRGQLLVHLVFDDTVRLAFRSSYVYDVWVVQPTGEHYCIVAASPFKITPTISRFT